MKPTRHDFWLDTGTGHWYRFDGDKWVLSEGEPCPQYFGDLARACGLKQEAADPLSFAMKANAPQADPT
jgi:hypothetical protein